MEEEQGRFQTRDEDGVLSFESSLEACVKKASEDPTIWKISWTDQGTGERVRLVRRTFYQKGTNAGAKIWVYEPILLDVDINNPEHIRRLGDVK